MSSNEINPKFQRYVSQRLHLSFVTWGSPSNPPLLLVHGGRDNARSWDWIATDLCSDWYVIAPDLRGHGDSAWSPDGDYAPSAFVYDLAQLLDQLEINKVTVVAHSMGAHLALRLAGIYPEKIDKLVAIEGFGLGVKNAAAFASEDIGSRLRNWIEQKRSLASRTPRRYPSLNDAKSRMMEENSYLSDFQASHLVKHGVNRTEDGFYTWKFDHYVNMWDHIDIKPAEWVQLCRDIQASVLLIYGENSWVDVETDSRIDYVPRQRVVELPKAGHWPHHECLAETLNLIREFVA